MSNLAFNSIQFNVNFFPCLSKMSPKCVGLWSRLIYRENSVSKPTYRLLGWSLDRKAPWRIRKWWRHLGVCHCWNPWVCLSASSISAWMDEWSEQMLCQSVHKFELNCKSYGRAWNPFLSLCAIFSLVPRDHSNHPWCEGCGLIWIYRRLWHVHFGPAFETTCVSVTPASWVSLVKEICTERSQKRPGPL